MPVNEAWSGKVANAGILVYSTKDQLDADLVDSIEVPAQDPDAFNVFFRVNNRSEETVPVYVDDLLEPLAARSAPLLLL